ncbi:MAG TPA: triple tyrosine motif-containing protein, partial [Segetibacter sp.]
KQAGDSFITMKLPPVYNRRNFCMTLDKEGQVFFDHDRNVYLLSPQNKLYIWKPKEDNPAYGYKSMLVDRSGVLWLGGNGTGIQLYDLRIPRLSGLAYKASFHEDVLQNFLHVPQQEIQKTSLYNNQSYYIRWTKGLHNDLWFSRAGPADTSTVEVYHYSNGHLATLPWHYTDTIASHHCQINSLALDNTGKLWGIDFYMRPVYFDTLTHAVTVYPPLDSVNSDYSFTVSSLLIDRNEQFWISTALNGLFCYEKKRNTTVHYTANGTPGALPTNQLMNIIQDPDDAHILWIGSLGGGLIKFNKSTGRCTIYTTKEGLPNNTVYAILPDLSGTLWCSSNKGIFSFDRKKNAVLQSYISKDGLPGDEFNRYHFLQLPDGRMAFGGVDGYTVFNPLNIASDNYQPQIALTGININNTAADFGYPASPLNQAINSLDKIELPYYQNFLTFEFSALQYNITEKLQYRYMLNGFDEGWVYAGNNDVATYTNCLRVIILSG